MLERPPFLFPLLKAPSEFPTPFSVPSVQDWEDLWRVWDCITRGMIPPSMLFQKPIDLRHICLFYLGHIPAFLDIHLSKLLNEPNTEPNEFKVAFLGLLRMLRNDADGFGLVHLRGLLFPLLVLRSTETYYCSVVLTLMSMIQPCVMCVLPHPSYLVQFDSLITSVTLRSSREGRRLAHPHFNSSIPGPRAGKTPRII